MMPSLKNFSIHLIRAHNERLMRFQPLETQLSKNLRRPGQVFPKSFSKEYAFLQKRSEIDTPPAAENMTLMEAPDARASVGPPAVEPAQPKRPEQVLQPSSSESLAPEIREQSSACELCGAPKGHRSLKNRGARRNCKTNNASSSRALDAASCTA